MVCMSKVPVIVTHRILEKEWALSNLSCWLVGSQACIDAVS